MTIVSTKCPPGGDTTPGTSATRSVRAPHGDKRHTERKERNVEWGRDSLRLLPVPCAPRLFVSAKLSATAPSDEGTCDAAACTGSATRHRTTRATLSSATASRRLRRSGGGINRQNPVQNTAVYTCHTHGLLQARHNALRSPQQPRSGRQQNRRKGCVVAVTQTHLDFHVNINTCDSETRQNSALQCRDSPQGHANSQTHTGTLSGNFARG